MSSFLVRFQRFTNEILVLLLSGTALLIGGLSLYMTQRMVANETAENDNQNNGNVSNVNESSITKRTISIILATKNEARNIGKTLRTLENATVDKSRVELVIVDVESKDNTIEVAKASAGVIPIRFVRKHDTGSGRGAALNEGFLRSTGDILLFIRADSLVSPGWDVMLRREMSDPSVLLGAFKFAVDRASMTCRIEPSGLWLLEHYFNWRSSLLQLPSFMQGISITADNFSTRQFSDLAIMDDVEFVLRSRHECIVSAISASRPVAVNSQQHGVTGVRERDTNYVIRSPDADDDSPGNTTVDTGTDTGSSAISSPRSPRKTLPLTSRTTPLVIRWFDLPLRCSPVRWEAMGVLLWLLLDSLAHILFADLGISPEKVYTICYDVLPRLLKPRVVVPVNNVHEGNNMASLFRSRQ